MENFTPLELFNKIYKYLEKRFYGYSVIMQSIDHGKRFDILYYKCPIVSFYFMDNNLYYSTDANKFNEIKTIKDVEYVLYKLYYCFCDGEFSLFLKCNLI